MLEASIALDELPDASARCAREAQNDARLCRLRLFRRFDEYERAVAELGVIRALSPPGRTNWTSGTTQSREVLSRKRTASAMSSGWIISSFGTSPSTQSVMARGHEPGAEGGHLDAVLGQLLVERLAQPDHAELRGRVGRQPALAVLAGDRGGVHHQRLAVLGARLLQQRDRLARER